MTIKDIAKEAGYSVGTVSRVLNNHPDVSDKARKKVMAVVKKNHFKLNNNAKHLKSTILMRMRMKLNRHCRFVVNGSPWAFFF